MPTTTPTRTVRCQGKRRMWRGHTLGDFKCGRKAAYTFQTSVGYSRSHFVCGDADCTSSITEGYPASNWRELGK